MGIGDLVLLRNLVEVSASLFFLQGFHGVCCIFCWYEGVFGGIFVVLDG